MNQAILITDGECGFCQRSARKLENLVSNGWINRTSNSLEDNFGLTSEQLAKSVWLIEFHDTEIKRFSGAKAVGKVLRIRGGLVGTVGWLTFIPPTSWVAAGLYRLVANNRNFFGKFI